MKAKSYEISKYTVLEAYKRVKANRGAAGVDKQSLGDFEKNLENNLYKIWNRMSSGSYFPPPVREKQISKDDGKVRVLGIPTVGDRVAQMVAKLHLEPLIEPQFHVDSYGYRPGKGAIQAVAITRQRCWRKQWVIDLDIKGFFDNLDHEMILKAVRHHTDNPWLLLYKERWLKAPMQKEDGAMVERNLGSPQGGVISPLLANLFMHYAFDLWVQREFPQVQFARYADDVIVHAISKGQASYLLNRIRERLAECKLELHPQKTKIVYCGTGKRTGKHDERMFDFLGFTFKPRKGKARKGHFFTSFNPAVSKKAAKKIRDKISNWRIPNSCSTKTLSEIAVIINATVRGWIAYYGQFYKGELFKVLYDLNKILVRWAVKKLKRFKGSRRKAATWLNRIAKKEPKLFAMWNHGGRLTTGR